MPFEFLVTIYALNVVAWGRACFSYCSAMQEMYWALGEQKGWTRDLVHLYSSKRMWVEADSQILNVLFCITSFGLASWRFSDLYYLLRIADPH
jgi:hypothetical protein